MTYDNTNRGSIWKNDRKTTDTHPDFTGTLNVEGVEYFFDAWKRKQDANPKAPALTFSIKRKDKQPETPSRQPSHADKPAAMDDFADDDIPF